MDQSFLGDGSAAPLPGWQDESRNGRAHRGRPERGWSTVIEASASTFEAGAEDAGDRWGATRLGKAAAHRVERQSSVTGGKADKRYRSQRATPDHLVSNTPAAQSVE